MRYSYGEPSEGEGFLSPDDLFPAPGVVEFIIQHGQDALDALDGAGEDVQRLIEEMIEAGLLERDVGGGLRLTPRMVKGMQHRALLEIFRDLKPGIRDGHATPATGRGGERTDGTRPYVFGDAMGEIDTQGTLRSALARAAAEGRPARPPLGLTDRDFSTFNTEATAETALCVLLDLSGSMARYGRHIAAKKVAMGLRALVSSRFPLDTVDFIGFASVAETIKESELPLVMPKPITTRAWEVKLRVPLDQAALAPPHFTNLHHGLQLARSTLARRGAANKQVFIITDGEPTAHLSSAKDSGKQTLNLIYPPSPASERATLEEALRCRRAGIRIASFALIEEYHAMEWVGFVERLTRLTRGVAYYCAAGDLASTIVESYLTGKKTKRALG